MTRAPVAVGPPPGVDVALLRSVDAFVDVVAHVPDAAWDEPSPCAGWTLRDLVGHVVESLVQIEARVRGAPFSRHEHPGDAAGADPRSALDTVARSARDAIGAADLARPTDTPHGRSTLADALAFPVADLAVHAWDVGRAIGRDVILPADLVAHVVHTAGSVPEQVLRRPDLFGPARPAPEGADDTTRVVAWLGRDVTPCGSTARSGRP